MRRAYYKKKKSCSNTPQQYGIVEKKHKHLLETTRALPIRSKLPNNYWNDCVLTTAHLINGMPLKSIQFLSPYEKLFNKPPDLSLFRVFGSLCYIYTSPVNLNEFAHRAHPSVLIGYHISHKAYKVLDLAIRKIVISKFSHRSQSYPHSTYTTNLFLPYTRNISISFFINTS